MGKAKGKVAAVRVPGPLAPYADGFECDLVERGYAAKTRATHLQVMSHVSRWLQAHQLGVGDLSRERVEQYLDWRRGCGYQGFCSRRGLRPLLATLGSLGLLPDEVPTARIDVLLGGFDRYLRQERGVASCTSQAYLAHARRFLADYGKDGDLRELTPADVSAAVLQQSRVASVGTVQLFVTALRSLLRYCCLAGLIETDLCGAALPVGGRRRSSLPTGVSPADARALLRSCDRRTVLGRRDYAVILTLLRLGLRAGEVAALSLQDLDWRAGQMLVHGKGDRVDRLPIPADVGAAITAYLLRGRVGASRREVFLRTRAPRTGLARTGVSCIVRRACVRAGVTPFGAHRLRHALACEMVRARVPLFEIGQILRHDAAASTARYARVDVDQLRTVAQPWPGGPVR